MKISIISKWTALLGVSFAALLPTFAETVVTTAAPTPSVQYAVTIGRPAAAPAEAGSENLLAASDAAAKARTQVERELAVLGTAGSSSGTATRALVVPREE